MDSMNFNWLSQAAATPSYPYLGYSTDISLVPEDISNTDVVSLTRMEDRADANPFLSGFLEYPYSFDVPFGGGSTSVVPGTPNSTSPPAHTTSVLRNGSIDGVVAPDDGEPCGRRSSSEEKDVTPAQSRRKAQNRAAQRAFRERKERHVRDLEAKLNLLTTTTSSLQSDNERLKLMLRRVQTENEMLKATALASHSAPIGDSTLTPQSQLLRSPSKVDAPRFGSTSLPPSLIPTTNLSPRMSSSSAGNSRLLSAKATWELLQSHPLYVSGAVNAGEVSEGLKRMARCEGMGPMFREAEVLQVIDQVRGRDRGHEPV